MAASDGANFQPAGTTVQVTNITVTTPERPDAPPDRLAKAREEARNEIHNQIVEQFPQTRQMLVDPRRIAQLRAHLITKYQLSERQATEVLKNYVNDPGNMISNRADTNVQNAMAGQGEAPQPPTGAAGEPNPNPATDAARADARPTDGRDLARMATRGGSATATPPPPPGSPTPPPKGTMTTATTATLTPPPPPPVPGGMTRGTSS